MKYLVCLSSFARGSVVIWVDLTSEGRMRCAAQPQSNTREGTAYILMAIVNDRKEFVRVGTVVGAHVQRSENRRTTICA